MQVTEFSTITGKGIYPIPMVAKLVGVGVQSIYTWVRAYEKFQQKQFLNKPLWKPEIFYLDGRKFLTFRDLLELRIISIFRRYHIHYKILASLSEVLSYYYQTDNPFVNARLSTDGKNIYIKDNIQFSKVTNVHNRKILLPTIEVWMEKEVVELENGDLQITKPFSSRKLHDIIDEYDNVIDNEIRFESQKPVEWCVDPKAFGDVCLNPEYHAGYPTVGYIPTETLSRLFEEGMKVDEISAMYAIKADKIDQAIRFEREYLN